MFLGSSCCNIAENSTFARPLDFACRLNPSFHAFAEACATETLGAYHHQYAPSEGHLDLRLLACYVFPNPERKEDGMGREGRDYWVKQLSEYWESGLTIQGMRPAFR